MSAIKIRIGAPLIDYATICPLCGKTLDRFGLHSTCCAPSESTKGHYKVRDRILELTALADPSCITEAYGLLPDAPTLRPADLLITVAILGCSMALDIVTYL